MGRKTVKRPPSADRANESIPEYLKGIRFRRKFFGGVDEYDVWRKIRKLDEMYAREMETQRIKYETLIAEREAWYRMATQQAGNRRANGDADGNA